MAGEADRRRGGKGGAPGRASAAEPSASGLRTEGGSLPGVGGSAPPPAEEPSTGHTPASDPWDAAPPTLGDDRIPQGGQALRIAAGELEEIDELGPEGEEREGPLLIADRSFRSRLILGTGKYADPDVMLRAFRAADVEMVTVAVRRVDLDRKKEEGILHHLDPHEFFLLANTAGCYTAGEAIRYARLARAAGFNEWLKLEVIGDETTLLPDVQATIEAAKTLTDEGFKVLAYTNDDLISALRLEDAGCVAVMPLASPIGSGMGLVNPYFIREIKRRLEVPVIVDAGVGTASHACETMEQGVDGVLMNTAVAAAEDPVAMAVAMRHAVLAGRLAFLAGRMPSREIAVPSSPTRGMLD